MDDFEDPKVRWLRRHRYRLEPSQPEQLWHCPACGTENSEDRDPWRCAACFHLHPSLCD
jgi:rubrerythrin